jgi:hypothetical protein
MQTKALGLIESLRIKSVTKGRFIDALQLMVDAKDEARCSIFRNELQGMLNALEPEGIVSLFEFEQLGTVFGVIWKAKAKSFYLTKKAIEKAQLTGLHITVAANRIGELEHALVQVATLAERDTAFGGKRADIAARAKENLHI